MKPLHLEVCGFGPFRRQQTIDFSALDSLFVISGETGSGKTTLFDAISYALYEEPLGKRSKKSIRCDFCGEEDSTWVRFRFEAGGATWEIYRAPHFVRRKLRGTGNTIDQITTLHRIDGAERVALAAKPSEVTKTIVDEVLHLTHEQFSKILVLPQGEFQKFLEEESKDRSKLLRKLFPVSLHEDLVTRVQQHATDLTRKATKLESVLGGSRDRLLGAERDQGMSHREVDAALDDRAAHLKSALADRSTSEAEQHAIAAGARKALEAGRAVQEKLERRVLATARLKRLELQAPEIRLAQAELAAARRGSRAVSALDRFDDLQVRTAEGRKQVEITRTDLVSAERAHTAASLALAQLPAIEAGIESAQNVLTRINERLPRLTQLSTARRHRDEAAEKRDHAAQGAAAQRSEVERLEASWAAFEGLDTRASEALQVRDEAVAAVQGLLRLQEAVEGVEHFAREVLPARQTEQAADSAEQARLEVLLVEARGRLDAARVRWKSADAARLAVHLVDGEPCPVCGGTEHPSPARADGALEVLEALVESAEREVSQSEAVLVQHGRVLTAHATKHDARMAQARAEEVRMVDAGYAEPVLWRAALAEARSREVSANTVWQVVREEQSQAGRVQKQLDAARVRLSGLEREHSAAAQTEASKAGRVTELEAAVGTVVDVGAAIAQARQEQAELDEKVHADKARCTALRRAESDASRTLSARQSQLAEQADKLQSNEQALEVADRALTAALREHEFADVQALKDARRTSDQERILADKVQRWSEDIAAVRRALEELAEALNGVESPDLPLLSAALEVAEKGALEATELRTRAEEAIARFDKERAVHAGALEALQEAVANSAGFIDLNRVLSGNNGKKVKFPDWVLSWWLDQVLVQANTRLRVLSEGRYRLLRRDGDPKDKRKSAGLDLDIFDAQTGHPREVNTMSGGEKFLTSVSLALGLADVIQMNSGAIELDTLFIDEGFGTLSDHFRDLVLEALDELGSTRQVGVISHVKEVKAFIPCQVQLHKSLDGSTVTVRA
ncbi:MAG TPA: hypothetical protein DFR83_22600 [Deltaproteobacteria bacterium]|nr:hypothetical protein [Deltaproteobacteria bacterium]